nr:DNA-binding protein [Actinoplanes derwentensis]
MRSRFGGVSRQRAFQLTSRVDFPFPGTDLAQGKVWPAADADVWTAESRRPPAA